MAEAKATARAETASSGRTPILLVVMLTAVSLPLLLGPVHDTATPVLAWAPAVLASMIGTYACLRSRREMTGATRLFWWRIGLAVGVATAGIVLDAADSLPGRGVPGPHIGALAMSVYLGCLLMVTWALLMIPIGPRTRKEWLALGLDAGITFLGASLFVWYDLNRQGAAIIEAKGGMLVVIGLSSITAVAVAKVALTGIGPLDHRALGLLAGAAFFAPATGGLLVPFMETRPYLANPQLSMPVVVLFILLGADRQRRSASAPVRERPRRRSYSLIGSLLDRLDASMGELARYERRFRALQRYSSDVTTIVGEGGKILYISPGIERVLGEKPEDWIGRHFMEAVHPDDIPIMADHSARLLADPGGTYTCQVRMRHGDGSWRLTELYATNSYADPAVNGIVSNIRDITEIHRVQEELAHQAGHDALTELANRALLVEHTQHALAGPGGHRVALALIDLDDFKTINDRLGHAVGDALLIAIAGRLRNCVRPGDMVARLGGDEFAILLHDLSTDQIHTILDRISTALTGIVNAHGHDLLVHASIGLAQASGSADATELLRRADVAMYTVKENGKGGHRPYNPDMDARADERARLGADLQHGFTRGELFLVYQPVVTLPDGDLYGVETLIRWTHPERGLISPAEFIPLAERNGTIVQIGAWVLREACHQMVHWQHTHGTAAPGHLAVNVSARQLREPSFAQTVADTLTQTGLHPHHLLIEITETAVFDDGLALQAAIATSIAQIAHALNLTTVAEGVETAPQAHRLYQMGYRLAQGYHFAKPLPPQDIDTLITLQHQPRTA
ncbi:putative bifunctional diguanylate cyclase/phosphodiesterase [Spirillospora albida]|uniref:putative bifunctional diguanylate cyclase/phosphodiesterase n=1 Tax=Spirillospora albida TaxID=58123 RepID=UPI00068E0319|nr:EAL domain-containing protein [Spirillospora albida]